MTRPARTLTGESGVALIHMAVFLPMLLLFTGLAVDTGRAYVVKAQLSKAVDGAALSAARNLNGGNPKGEAGKVFRANFPANFMGSFDVTDPVTPRRFLRDAHRRRERDAYREHQGDGQGADDLHADRQLHRDVGGGLERGDAPAGGPVARARRLGLDRPGLAGGPRRGAQLHRCLRQERRSHGARHLQLRCEGAGSDAGRLRLRQGQAESRCAELAAGRHHVDGRGPLSRLGRSALGRQRAAGRAARHRALHRRVRQRSPRVPRRERHRQGRIHRRFPEGAARPDQRHHEHAGDPGPVPDGNRCTEPVLEFHAAQLEQRQHAR